MIRRKRKSGNQKKDDEEKEQEEREDHKSVLHQLKLCTGLSEKYHNALQYEGLASYSLAKHQVFNDLYSAHNEF